MVQSAWPNKELLGAVASLDTPLLRQSDALGKTGALIARGSLRCRVQNLVQATELIGVGSADAVGLGRVDREAAALAQERLDYEGGLALEAECGQVGVGVLAPLGAHGKLEHQVVLVSS